MALARYLKHGIYFNPCMLDGLRENLIKGVFSSSHIPKKLGFGLSFYKMKLNTMQFFGKKVSRDKKKT